jgi:transcription initiation factor TFIID subunit 13
VLVDCNMAELSNTSNPNALTSDIRDMMYGFGDVADPDPASVELMDGLVREYIAALCAGCCKVADLTNKLDKESVLFLVRKDRKKYDRVCKLLRANELVKRSTKIEFDDSVEE